MSATIEQVDVDGIDVLPSHRTPDPKAVERLAASIKEIGLRTPITVRYFPDRPQESTGTCDSYVLVAGGHRLAAAKLLGLEKIECFVVDEDDQHARLWEIAENLHREDLPRLERAEQIAEWIKITLKIEKEKQVGQLDPPDADIRYEQRGTRLAARQLPLDGDTDEARRMTARRALSIAKLTPEAKEEAKALKLDNVQEPLVKAARFGTPEEQVECLQRNAKRIAKSLVSRKEKRRAEQSTRDMREVARGLRKKFTDKQIAELIDHLSDALKRAA